MIDDFSSYQEVDPSERISLGEKGNVSYRLLYQRQHEVAMETDPKYREMVASGQIIVSLTPRKLRK